MTYPNPLGYSIGEYRAYGSLGNLCGIITAAGISALESLTETEYSLEYDRFREWAMSEMNRFGLATLDSYKGRREHKGLHFEPYELWTLISPYVGRLYETMDRILLSRVGAVEATPRSSKGDNLLCRSDGKEIVVESKGGVQRLAHVPIDGRRTILLGHARQYDSEGNIDFEGFITVVTNPGVLAALRERSLNTERKTASLSHVRGSKGMAEYLDKHTYQPWEAFLAIQALVEKF